MQAGEAGAPRFMWLSNARSEVSPPPSQTESQEALASSPLWCSLLLPASPPRSSSLHCAARSDKTQGVWRSGVPRCQPPQRGAPARAMKTRNHFNRKNHLRKINFCPPEERKPNKKQQEVEMKLERQQRRQHNPSKRQQTQYEDSHTRKVSQYYLYIENQLDDNIVVLGTKY